MCLINKIIINLILSVVAVASNDDNQTRSNVHANQMNAIPGPSRLIADAEIQPVLQAQLNQTKQINK